MSSFWVKVGADLLAHKGRTALAIVSVAMGMFALAVVLSLIDLQTQAMDAAQRQSQPSHISMILRSPVAAETLRELRQLPEVADIDVLTQRTVRYKTATMQAWKLGTMIWRPDYQRQKFDLLRLTAGAWPGKDSIAIERLSADYARLQVGDRLSFATRDGSRDFTLSGIVRHPFVKPPRFGGQLHFFVDASLAGQFDIPTDSYSQLLVRMREPYDLQRLRGLAADLRGRLAARGINVNASLLQDPEQHWGRSFFAGINLVLQVMAWAILALGCVLVINTYAAHVTQQVRQIGILKALGARRNYISRLYLTEVLISAGIALLLALPLAAGIAYVGSRWLLNIFNVEFNSFQYSPTALLYTTAAGVVVPVLAALGPIRKGANITVREAIARHGLGSDFGRSRLDRYLESLALRYLSSLQALALGNLFRRKGQLLLTQTVLIIAGVAFMVVMSLIQSLNLTLDHELARSRYDVRVGLMGDPSSERIAAWISELPGTMTVEFWDRASTDLLRDGQPLHQVGSLGAQVLALPLASRLYQPLIAAGRWFEARDSGTRSVVISADTAAENGIGVGDRIAMRLHGKVSNDWEVIGTYRWLAGSSYAVEPVYAPRTTVQDLRGQPGGAALAMIQADLADLAAETEYLDRLRQKLEAHGVGLDVYATTGKREQREYARNQFRPATSMLLGVASLVAAVGTIGMSGTLALGVLQRVREIGVLRSLGARSATVFALSVLEALFHAILSWLVCVPLAYLAAPPLAEALGLTMLKVRLEFAFDYRAVLLWLGLILVLALLAAVWPARNAVQVPVRLSLDD